MRIEHHKPAARGVNQLMYVGDDAATAPSGIPVLTIALVAAAAWLLLSGRR